MGGPGGRGGFGGNSVERLVQNTAVQDELKITEKQKTSIKTLVAQVDKKRKQVSDNIPKLAAEAAEVAKAEAAEVAAATQADAAANAQAARAAAQNRAFLDPLSSINNNYAGANPNDNPTNLDQGAQAGNNGGNNNGGRGGRGGNNIERQMMREAMTSLQQDADAAFLKILDAKQKVRVKQIALQSEGPQAFTNPNVDVAAKLDLTEEQITDIREAANGLRQSQRDSMQKLFASVTPPADPNADPNANNNGGRGGRGGFPNLDKLDEATRAKFLQQMQDARTKGTSETMAAIAKLLSKAQKATYKKMVGEPFDLTKLQGPGGPWGPGRPGGPPPAATATATATATPASTATPAPAATEASKAATKPAARKSLRESRGGN